MPKKGAVQLWISRQVVTRIDERRRLEFPGMSRVAYAEKILLDYVEGRLVRSESLTTEKIFIELFSDSKRMDELFAFLKERLSENEKIGRFLDTVVHVERRNKKT